MTVKEAHMWMQGQKTVRYDYPFNQRAGLDKATCETRIFEADAAMRAIAYYTLEYHNKNRYGFVPENV